MGIRRLLRLRAAFKASSAIGLLAALTLPPPAAAQSIWGGSGSTTATTDYNTATNWSNPPGVAPTAAGTSAVFANTGQGTVNVSAPVTTNSWTFATNAQSYAFTGALVTFNTSAGLIDNANAGQSISIDNSLGGAGGIALNGSSTLTLTGGNGYTGATTIGSGATLALSGFGAIPASSVVTANGTFDISGSAIPFKVISTLAGSGVVKLGDKNLAIFAGSTEFSGTIAGAGGLEIAGGTQTLSGVNTYTGVTQVDLGGTLALKGNGSIANSLYLAFLGGGTFDISQTKNGASVAGLLDPVGTGVVSLGSKTLTLTGNVGPFNGVIQDGGIGGGTGGNVTVASGGFATFGGINTYTGLTTINAGGELDLNGSGSIASSSGVANSGTFDISNVTGSGTQINGLTGGSSGVVNLGAKTLTINNAGGTYAGAIVDGGLGGGLTILGGTQTLSGVNTYTGETQIGPGATLALKGNGSIANSSLIGFTGSSHFDISQTNSGASVAGLLDPVGTGAVSLGSKTLTLTGNVGPFNGVIQDGGIAGGAGGNVDDRQRRSRDLRRRQYLHGPHHDQCRW